MKKLISGDWQLCDNPRDRYRTDFLEQQMKPLITKYQPDQFIFLGDLTEEKDSHPARLVNEIVNFFDEIGKCCEVIFLQGNHDFLHKGHPYFKFLQDIGVVDWIDEPTVKDNCLFLPHTRDYKKDWVNVDFDKDYDFVFAHNIFTGANANGQKLSGIPTNIFKNEYVCISGDVHEPQIIDEKVIYVGAPFLCDFGDDYVPRVLLLDDLLVKSIKVAGPQKRVVDVHWDEDNSNFSTNGAKEGDIVKLKVNLQMSHVAEWDKIRSWVSDWATNRGMIVNTIQPIVNYEQGARAKVVKSVKKSDLDYLNAFVKRAGADERTVQVGKDLLVD